jgi:hypothetical protein
VLITPHTAGRKLEVEDNELDILVENLDRLWGGESTLRNEIAWTTCDSRPSFAPECGEARPASLINNAFEGIRSILSPW